MTWFESAQSREQITQRDETSHSSDPTTSFDEAFFNQIHLDA
jgi:hypothetical protein